MDLLSRLTQGGLLDEETARRVSARASEAGGALTTALLELDAVGEDPLLRALEAHHGVPAADLADLEQIDPELAERLPEDLSLTFVLCPIRFQDYGVLVWVEAPLSAERLEELRRTAGLEAHQRVAAGHHVAVARARMYGHELESRAATLEATLARRRASVTLEATLRDVAAAATLKGAITAASAFFRDRLEVSTFFVVGEASLRAIGMRGAILESPWVPMPSPGCTLAAALRYGGYFLGPVTGSAEDEAFFGGLSRSVPSRAFVAPLPTRGGSSVVFFGENGPRTISARLAAEISLITARLAQRDESWASLAPPPEPETVEVPLEPEQDEARTTPGAVEAPLGADTTPGTVPAHQESGELVTEHVRPAAGADAGAEAGADAGAAPSEPSVTPEEREVLARLREAAAASGLDLRSFVEGLLAPAARAPESASPALAGEVKELFERLATDIPTQLARGMEAAFRDLGPRIAAGPAPPAPRPAARPSAADGADLLVVKQDAKPREVASYRSKRAKTKRRKL